MKRVIGVEILEAAVRDAEKNAALNGITTAEFHAAPVEKVIDRIVAQVAGAHRVVAILDPPRSGVPGDVIRTIRRCAAIHTLVYVACDAAKAGGNFLDLCRLPSNRIAGPPFQISAACGVDLFPHTPHTELVLQFTR